MKNRNPKSDKRKMDSDDESSEEDGSTNAENSHPVMTIEDSDEDSDSNKGSSESEDGSSSDTSSDIQVMAKKRKLMRPSELLSDSSDSGDETCEKCAICLRSILNQEVGSPEGCDHLFCSVCIIEWSKNSNVCPLDRQQFSIILVRKSKSGSVVKQLPVEEPKSLNIFYEGEDHTFCEICGDSDREETMLLCDGCERGYHIECLTPPLEEVPAEEEWFCPNCAMVSSLEETNNILENIDEELNQLVHSRIRATLTRPEPRRSRTGTRIRTRLLERIRVAVNRIVRSCFLDENDDDDEDEDEDYDDDDENFDPCDTESEDYLSEELVESENQPGTSGTQRKLKKCSTSTKRRKTKRKRNTRKTSSKRKTKKTTKKRKSGIKRKAKSKSTIRTKNVRIQNPDGSIKVVKTRTYKRRRKQKVKKKVKTAASLRRFSGNTGTPKTVKGRLALTLGMIAPKRPGQLLPDVKIRSSRNELSGIDINRARAGIPRLHIFEPRHELQLLSSDSDGERYARDESGPVATLAQPRITISSIRDRKRAALLLQSTPTVSVKPKPVVEEPPKEFDILSSILDSQAIWHSKNTDVKIHEDGSIEVLKKTESIDKKSIADESKMLDVRGTNIEGLITQAPMYPGSSSRPGAFRQYNRNSFGESGGNQDSSISARSSVNQSGVGLSRFGGTPRNDREGYANYLNSMPQGPIPFCRGGPPLRFRMPSRQQLRRFPFPPRMNRSPWQNEEEDGENESKNSNKESQAESNLAEGKKAEEEDVDLYSDIETNAEKAESPEREEGSGTSYPALGPPPEPSAFLLGIDENGEVTDKKNTSDVYDPAEPCDSEDEMVIDENVEKAQSPNEDASEPETSKFNYKSPSTSPSEAKSPKQVCQRGSTEDEDDECPIFSIYSSASREFSQKEEEEREREIAEEKRKLEEMELHDPKPNPELSEAKETTKIDNGNGQMESRKGNFDGELEPELCDPNTAHENFKEKASNRSSIENGKGDSRYQCQDDEDSVGSRSCPSHRNTSRSRSGTPGKCLSDSEHSAKSPIDSNHSIESEKVRRKSSSLDRLTQQTSRRRSKSRESDSDVESKKQESEDEDDDSKRIDDRNKIDKNVESESESLLTKVATGLEGLDVEEVSSDNEDGDDCIDKRSLSSLSLSELSNRSQESPSRLASKKRKKRKRRKGLRKVGKKYDDVGDEDMKDKQKGDSGNSSKVENEDIENEGQDEKHRRRKSISAESDRQVLGNKENKKDKSKEKDKDLSWKKPSKKEKNYREGKKRSKERGRSRSKDRRKSRSSSPKKDKKKNKDRKKKSEKKKEIERYDVRKIVKNKEIRKTDAFGRDIISKSRSLSRSRSRSPIRERSRNMLRRDSRSYTRSRSRSYRRGRSPIRRRYIRSRTKSRSQSPRRSFSRSRSRSRSIRKSKKKFKSKERLKGRSRSRGRKSRSRRRSLTRSRSRSPIPRMQRGKKPRSRRSWSHHSRSFSFSPRRSRSFSRSPVRVRRSYTRSVSSSWSRGRSPMPRATSLEKLTVVLKTKDRKKGKKKKEGKRGKRDEERRKKIGNSKEVFASGDNVLVSVNFRNNNNSTSNNNNGSVNNDAGRNTRLDSSSPAPSSDRKKRRGSEYEIERVSKKSKKSNTISKNVVDMALSNSCSKRAKKLTRLSEKDAEVILNRKPVAVIDLDLSPYREQTPSPINVVVVSDSGSGDEGKEQTPQRQNIHGSPGSEAEKNKESADKQSANVSVPSSPVANGYLTGPKTPPEPQIKFSITKPQQLRQIANPLGDDDDDDDDAEEEEEQESKRIETVDRRIEKELDSTHKGPNTPPEPRGPTTPKTPPSPQTSPDAYDPFEPTKSRSPTPSQDKEDRKSPQPDQKDDQATISEISITAPSVLSEMEPTSDSISENQDDKPVTEVIEKGEAIPALEATTTVAASIQQCTPVQETRKEDSPERKISAALTGQQSKVQPQSVSQKSYTPALKPVSVTQTSNTAVPPVSSGLTLPFSSFPLPSPTKSTRTSGVTASQPVQMSGIQRLQHRLGSPVNRTPNSVKSTPEKRSTPRTESNDLIPSGTYRAGPKRNGEQVKQARPLLDSTNETIDMTVDMDDSPYSPASSEGDDLFDPPTEPTKPTQTNPKTIQPGYKPPQSKGPHRSPIKQLSKFDLLFGPSGPTLSPLKVASKKQKTSSKTSSQAKPSVAKPAKKTSNSKRGISLKMDEDQLRILDELPSSAVELQVKDKFLKKLNRQERVVDEVKTVLKPHYARKHITKEEYKDILRRSVPKICHSRSGEINPSKIQSLIEAYVRKFRHAKKKGASSNPVSKPKVK